MAQTAFGPEWECTLSLSPTRVLAGTDSIQMTVILSAPDGHDLTEQEYNKFDYKFSADDPRLANISSIGGHVRANPLAFVSNSFTVPPLPDGDYTINVTVTLKEKQSVEPPFPPDGITGDATLTAVGHEFSARAAVTLQRTGTFPTDDQALWVAIRNRTSALDFARYQTFINRVFCIDKTLDINSVGTAFGALETRTPMQALLAQNPVQPRQFSIFGPYAYIILKLATQVFLTLECGVFIKDRDLLGDLLDIDKERIRLEDPTVTFEDLKERLKDYLLAFDNHPILPYLDRIVANLLSLDQNDIREVLPYCFGILQHRLTAPSLQELIWSYWHEEGMLIQTMNTIALRFQNRRGSQRDPLIELELDPLRPLNNLIWGFIQDEHNRLTVPRRAAEYHHHYGLSLVGRATATVMPADTRSKFIEAFHNLLYRTALFYKEDADTTVIAEAFPLLNALKEVHLIMAEGAHNQFGDLPWTSRCEMLTMQWMLARPEMREFLRGRYMVPYQEEWMGAVDSMKRLQGWTDTTVTHFHELAITGERILLSVRYGDWVDIENIQEQAKNWARYWKPEVQRYIHGFQAVTGVDLTADVVDTRDAAIRFVQPSILLQRRLEQQRAALALPARRADMSLPPGPAPIGALPAGASRYAEAPIAGQRRLPRLRPNR
jgi:hypothetical protein